MASKENCYMNRELSWLKFNERVLNEAGNPRVPLAERLFFTSVYQTNLDEFYMVRVGTLMDQVHSGHVIRENKTHMTSDEQVKAILKRTKELNKKKEQIYGQLMEELETQGVRLIDFKKLTEEEAVLLETYFDEEISPFLSPMIVGKQQPFPFLKGRELYTIVLLNTKGGKSQMGIIPCSNNVFKRLIEIPTRPGMFILSEELILLFVPKLFKKYTVKEKAIVRVTRNADIDAETIYDEDLDYRDAMAHLIKTRKSLSPVRVEISRKLNDKLIEDFCHFLKISEDHVFISNVPLDLSFVFQLQKNLQGKSDMFFEKRTPQYPAELIKNESIIAQIEKKDVLLAYPFESMKPFISMLHEAAADESVVSIKMTLYRVAKESKIIEALVEAAENGKEVVALMELRARFDEENNIEWSKVLQDSGCQIIYGLEHYKVHSKLCLITRKTADGLSYITQIGTGNYNEKTAKLYTDLSLITTNKEIGSEAAKVFNALLMGDAVEETKHLLVAPKCLQNKVIAMIDEEIGHVRRGEAAYIGLKINSLTDKDIIDKLIEASQAGVKVEMIIRGICCLISGVEGLTDHITVISIVGRFLEHSRIYRFGVGEREKIYISSADFMTRNTLRRVEIAVPIYDENLKAELRYLFNTAMKDDEKGKIQNTEGNYEDWCLGEQKLNSQELFYQNAYDAVKK